MPLEQHPVPQHISAYQFHLVGEMTVRQFGFLAGGCVIALLFYASPLTPFIKWPLVIFFVFIGVALAFMPLQERPLDKWIVAFIKAIFSPTQFVWEKKPQTPDIFKVVSRRAPTRKEAPSPPDKEKLEKYLETLPTEPKSSIDVQEESFVKRAIDLFEVTKPPAGMAEPVFTPPLGTGKTFIPPTQKVIIPPSAKKVKPTRPVKTEPVKLSKKKVALPEKPTRPEPRKPTAAAKFSPELPFPEPPSQANTLVGMALDQEGKIIEGAIIEIRDSQGIPVRALKTNKLGQFRSVTPLDDGQYEIETEKEGYQFDILKVDLTGKIVQPLEIRAKTKTSPQGKGKTNEPAQNA